ncbi:MAG: redoxin family protein [Pseudomonadota bacterium]
MRLNFFVLMALAFVVISTQCSKRGPSENDPFPALTLAPLSGGSAWSPEMLKGKTTLIQVFAAWCPHCANEMDDLAALKKRFPNLQVIGIFWNDEPANLKPFLQRFGNPYDSIWRDTNDSVNRQLKIPGVPAIYVVDGTGVIRQHYKGALRPEVRDAYLIPYLELQQPKTETIR